MKFSLGQTVMASGVANKRSEDPRFDMFVDESFARYINGDWGELDKDDAAMNDEAIASGEDRIFAAYKSSDYEIWIITEWDRSVTTILFPSEY